MSVDRGSRHAPGIVVLPHVVGVTIDKDQGRHPFGVGGYVPDGDWTGRAMCNEHDLLAPDRIQHRCQSVRVLAVIVLIDCALGEVASRGSDPPAFEPHRPGEAAEAPGKVGEPGVLPEQVDGQGESRKEDEVRWPATDHLIGQAHPVGRRHIFGDGPLFHGASLNREPA